MLNCENFYSITDISPKAFIYKQNSLVMVECETIWYASLFNLLNCFFFENETNIEKHISFVNGILDGMKKQKPNWLLLFYLVKFFKAGIKFIISASKCKQIIVVTALDDFTVFKHHNGIRISNC